MDSLESASTTDVSILRPGTVQYFLSRRPFSSREGTNPILNYFGSGSSPWLLVVLIHGGVNFRCEYTIRLRNAIHARKDCVTLRGSPQLIQSNFRPIQGRDK
jgi:hypothetical protein